MLQNDRYIGGGKIFFTPLVNGVQGTQFEIGEVQEGTLSFNVTTADAFSKDNVMKTLVAKVATSIDATLKFSTQIRNSKNTAMAMLGAESTETFAIGDTLPDGTTAAAEVVIPVIKAGTNPIIEGQVKFVGDEDGDKKPVLVVYNAVLTPTSDIAYISDDFSQLSFEGAVLKTANGYADEYTMEIA